MRFFAACAAQVVELLKMLSSIGQTSKRFASMGDLVKLDTGASPEPATNSAGRPVSLQALPSRLPARPMSMGGPARLERQGSSGGLNPMLPPRGSR